MGPTARSSPGAPVFSTALPGPMADAAADGVSLAGDFICCWFLQWIFSIGSYSFQGNLAQYLSTLETGCCVRFYSALDKAAESRRGDLHSITPRLLPARAASEHAKEEAAAVIFFKEMTTFPSNLQEDGKGFLEQDLTESCVMLNAGLYWKDTKMRLSIRKRCPVCFS